MSKLTPLMKEKLKKALYPRSIALIGASPDQLSVGFGTTYNLLRFPFKGPVFPVNPRYESILGVRCFKTIEEVTPPPDLVIFLVNHRLALEMIPQVANHGCSGGMIVAGGFKEISGEEGKSLERTLIETALKYEFPIIGPNTLGMCNLLEGVHAIFAHLDVSPNPPVIPSIAILSQSGGVGLTIASNLKSLGTDPAFFIGVGNRSIVDFEDYLEVLRDDDRVSTFCLFIEGMEYPRGLYETLKRLSPHRHIVAYKAGKHESVTRATVTHTGAVAGNYALYRTMFEQAGVIEVESSHDAAVVSKALSMVPLPKGNRLAIMTFTAGPSIVAMDRLVQAGWNLEPFTNDLLAKVRRIIGEKTPVDLQNPLDLTGPGFIPQTYSLVMEEILKEDFDAFLFIWGINPLIRTPIVEWKILKDRHPDKSIVFVLIAHAGEGLPLLREMNRLGICCYLTPEDGALALNALLRRRTFIERVKQ